MTYWSAKNGWSGMTFWYGFLLFIFLGAIEDNVFPDIPKTEIQQEVDNN